MKKLDHYNNLKKILSCPIFSDRQILDFYSVDSSSYRIKPSVVVFPKGIGDIIKIVKYAKRHSIPVTPRGGGTGLVGSCLGRGIILDMKYFDKIKIGKDFVEVGSGVSKGRLDKILERYNRMIGPDPSVGPYCTIGGMVGTNASGAHSLKYGSMIDNIIKVELVNAIGNTITLPDSTTAKKIIDVIHERKIEFPNVTKNSCGYRIDKIRTRKDGHKIMVGSEGTLGIVTKIKLKTWKKPKMKLLCIIPYKTLLDSTKDIPKIVNLGPSALEIVDQNIANHIKTRNSTKNCLVFVEFDENIYNIQKKISRTITRPIQYEYNRSNIEKIWAFRNSALALSLKSIMKKETTPTVIEDAVVPVKRLAILLRIIDVISRRYNLRTIIYGHAGNGNLHIRPILKHRNKKMIKKIATEFFNAVIKIGGSITAEHGDGLARSEFVKLQYGKEAYEILQDIKKEFDPYNILNPGKIITDKSTITENMKI